MQLRLKQLPQPQRNIRILGGIFHCLINGNLIKGNRRFSRPQKRFDADRFMFQITVRQIIHPMIMLAAIDRVRQQHRVIHRRNRHVVTGKNFGVIFHVLADFHNRRVLQNGT